MTQTTPAVGVYVMLFLEHIVVINMCATYEVSTFNRRLKYLEFGMFVSAMLIFLLH